MPLLELAQADKIYQTASGRRHVLKDVSCSVEEGEFVSVVGYSGSGKSTLIGLLSGLTAPTSGAAYINSKRLTGFAETAAIVFQNYSLLPWFSALENVRLALEGAHPGWGPQRHKDQAVRYLEMVGLQNALHKRPSQLSGGMRQRVAIARAFAVEPQLLFLDEPFGALDALTRGALQTELARLCSAAGRTVTVVMVTNSVEEAILLSDRILPLSRGPEATLGPAIPVSLPRPRTAETIGHDAASLDIEARVVEFLTGQGAGTQAQRAPVDPGMRRAASELAGEMSV